jgi:tetratricopeptide (TPR) repeat protein
MENLKQTGWWFVLAAVIFAVCGCNDGQMLKKQAMLEQWKADTAREKVPLVESMIDRGDIAQARKMLTECLEKDPSNADYFFLMGRIYFIEDNIAQARQCFETAVELDDQLASGWHCLGALAVLEKDYDTAATHYETACRLDPANADYVVSLAEVLVEIGQGDEARQRVSAMLDRHSRNLDLILALAQIQQRAGHVDQAVALYEEALLLHGEIPEILSPCAYGYLAMNQWADAARMFEKLLVYHKDDKVHYYATLRSLATCSFHAGRYRRAMACYDELSVAFRDDASVWLNMARCALGADDADQAIHYARKALKYQPDSPGAIAVLGSTCYLKGDYEQSLDHFSRLTGDEALAGFAWFMTGRCCQQLGRAEQASAAYQRARDVDPESELMTLFLKQTVEAL